MEECLMNLIEQFKLATGTKNVDVESQQFINDFAAWIKSRRTMGNEYTYFLDYLGFRFADIDCAEVGKCKYDSVVKPFETILITPSTSFEKVKPERIIKGNMRVYESVPVLVRRNPNGNQLSQIPNDIIRTYMTQNPYSQSSISGWENLHNSGNNDIILGIFGSIHDKDIKTRIQYLETLRDKLTNGDYIEDYSVSGDNYFYVVGSGRNQKKTKIKVKIKENIHEDNINNYYNHECDVVKVTRTR